MTAPAESSTAESDITLLVIAKQPVPGRVKTRLVPPCTYEQAASLAEAALADTLRAVRMTPARRRVLILDGQPGPWLPPGFDIVPQCAGPLDERLAEHETDPHLGLFIVDLRRGELVEWHLIEGPVRELFDV